MTNRKKYEPATREQLADEARHWESGGTPRGWRPADGAAPRAAESKQISLRLPVAMLTLLKAFAEREGIGYQVLVKRWLDDRLREERVRLRGGASARELPQVARSLEGPFEDVPPDQGVRRPAA